MRTRKRFFIIAAILIIIIGISICITYFLHQKSDLDIEQVIHNYTTLQENINQVEQSYLDDNGYVSIDNKEVLLNEIENTISENKKSGVIKDYKREEEGIFADLGGVGYLYSPPIEDTMSYSSDNIGKTETVKKEILTVEPYSTQPGMLLIYGVSGLDSPDGVAKEIVSTFPDNYVFPDENNCDTFLPDQGKELEEKSIIIWYGHGTYVEEYGPILNGSLEANGENIDIYSLYLAESEKKPAEMIIWNEELAYTPYYFQNHIEDNTLKGSLVYIAACFSMKDDRLADVFIEKGADLFIGNSEEINTLYNLNMMTTFFKSLTEKNTEDDYLNAEEALSAARNKHGEYDPWGSKSAQVLTKYATEDTEYRLNTQSDGENVNSKGPATQIEIRFSSDSGKESAVICGLNEQNEEVWNHTTGSYDRTELEQISEIGIYDDRFYYSEGGKIVSLALSNGSVMWENNEFGGASICSTIDNNGTIYMSGYYGPSFFAVDKDGATLVKIDSFGEEYYWPYAIEKIDDNTVVVTFEHGPEGAVAENEGFLIYVNLSDYSYSTIGANTTSSSQETNPINIFASMPSDFTFSSGAGGWATQFTLEDDGSFTGQYHDSDMGDTGTEYPNGTVYISKFTGKFTTPTQINDYTYSMQLENLQAEGTTGEEYYENGQRFIYSDPYGFDNADVFLIYTPGAPMAELPEGFKSWLLAFMNPNEEQTLPCYGIYNVGGEEGFVGFEDTRENAQSGFDSSEESTQTEANSNGEKILSTEQLEAIKTNLNVPADLNVDIEQSEPTYWDAGGCWVTYVTFSYGGKTVAAASVNSDTAELVKDILVYTP